MVEIFLKKKDLDQKMATRKGRSKIKEQLKDGLDSGGRAIMPK